MRAFCALPCMSATTRKSSPASGSVGIDHRARTIRQHKAATFPRALATRSGQACRRSAPTETGSSRAAEAGQRAHEALGHLPRCRRAGRPVGGKARQAPVEIDGIAAETALRHEHGEPRGGAALGAAASMCARRTGRPSLRIVAPCAVTRPSASRAPSVDSSARASGREPAPAAGRGRRACPGRRRRRRAVQHQRGEVRLENLGRRKRLQRAGLLGPPQADRDARTRAAGAPGPLVGGGARDAHRLEPRQAGGGLVARHARQS